jgi:serine/threonine protein kinase
MCSDRRNANKTEQTSAMTKFTRRKHAHARAHAHVIGHNQTGGIPIFAGAQGCVFKPALKCKNQTRNYNDGNISKLGQKEGAEAEMREYDKIKQYLRQIKNYKKYFSVQAELCEPDPLEPHDLVNFDDICTNLQRVKITATNVNANLSQLRMINMPDLGIDLKKWMEQTSFNAANLRQLNDYISKLLIHAVVPMNQLGVIHNDLKSENVMIDRDNNSRIIDWGLAGITTPTQVIPAHHFMNNPVTFNRPFSTMVISTDALELYSSVVLKSMAATEFTMERIKHFTRAMYKEYIDVFDISGYKYLQYICKSMFGSENDEMLMDAVATYNAEILYHFTDRAGLTFRLDEYFSKVYRYNTDVWGLMSVFYSMFMMPRKSFIMSDAAHADMLRRYRALFSTVVFANGHDRMNVSHIVQQLRQISDAVSKAPRQRTQKKRTVRVRFNFNMKPNPNANPKTIARVATPYPHNNAFYDRIIPKK